MKGGRSQLGHGPPKGKAHSKLRNTAFRQSGQVGTKGNWGMILSLAWLHGLVILIGRRQRKLTQTPGLGKQQKYA